MRFELDDRQREFQGAVIDYLSAECPVSRALKPYDSGQADFELWRGLMQLGLGGVMVPEQFGGLGLGLLDLAVMMEPIGRFAAPGPFLEHALSTVALVIAGSDEQKAYWLPELATGAKRGTVALAEGKGDWLSENWTLKAQPVVSGTKTYVLHPDGADVIVVGLHGGRLGLIELPSAGVTVDSVACTDAGKQMAHVTFADAPIQLLPASLGARVCDAGMVLLSADAFGGGSHCVNLAIEYSKQREQFGRPIGAFQAMKHQLADMALTIEPTIGLYWFAGHAFDHESSSTEAAALAKSHITDAYLKVARRAVEVHGGIGYTWEYGLHVWLKRALFNRAYLGSPAMHRQRVATLAGW